MKRRSGVSALALVLALAGCGQRGTPRAQDANVRIAVYEDDMAAAIAHARAGRKLVVVDLWATWCHSCLEMRAYVLNSPSLAPLASRVVIASVDTDRPTNAALVRRYRIAAWPTFLVVEPESGDVVAMRVGSMGVGAFQRFVEGALARRGSSATVDRALTRAARLAAEGRWAESAAQYAPVMGSIARATPLRAEASVGYVSALSEAHDWPECVRVARESLVDALEIPDLMMSCADSLPQGPERDAAKADAIARLRAMVSQPPENASTEDRAGHLRSLADALGDAAESRALRERALALLEDAANRAGADVRAAQVFDYQRMKLYESLGRVDDAVRLFTERARQLPRDREPLARLATTLAHAGRDREALDVVRRAISLGYGPPRLRLLKLQAEVQGRLGDRDGQRATLREEAAGYRSLPEGLADPEALRSAESRLSALEDAGATVDAR